MRKIVEKEDQREASAERDHRQLSGLVGRGAIEIRALAVRARAHIVLSQEERNSDPAALVSRKIVVAFEGTETELVGTAAAEET